MTLAVHILTIPRLSERRAALQASLKRIGIEGRFHDGFDRLEADPAAISESCSGQDALGDMCCTLGHLSIWREVVKGGQPALILEDDARPTAALRDWVEERAALVLDRLDVSLLKLEAWGGNGLNRTCPLGQPTSMDGVYRLHGRFVGSAAYVITPEAAGLGVQRRPGQPVDHLLFAPPFRLGPVAFASPAPVMHDPSLSTPDIERHQGPPPPRLETFRARLAGARRIPVELSNALSQEPQDIAEGLR